MSKKLKASAQKVQVAVNNLGFEFTIVEFSETTRTSADAASAIGCSVGQIAKTLVFRTVETNTAILVIASGINRVNVITLSIHLDEKIELADADFVRQLTGFAIGGVPPVGHLTPIITLIDEDLFQYEEIWAAAGTPNAVFRLKPDELQRMTGGTTLTIQ